MILLVHSLYFVFKYALHIYRRRRALKDFQSIRDEVLRDGRDVVDGELRSEQCLGFDPPAYRQRYFEVQQVLLNERWRKEIKRVVDFGCSEMGFFNFMKNLHYIEQVLEVDVDRDTLEQYKYRVEPLTADYLKQRGAPLDVQILCGSVADPDERLKDVDAVIAIELIEHLYPDTLEAFPYNVFGFIKPKVAVVTTPNADFNILFPNFKGFRHYDHKFEWTRNQFEDWSTNITKRYPDYSVTFHGIAEGPKGTESLGCCTQMAVFIKEYDLVGEEVPMEGSPRVRVKYPESYGICTYFSYAKQYSALNDLGDSTKCDNAGSDYYTLISTSTYPFKVDSRTTEEKILCDAVYAINRECNANSRYYNAETSNVEIPMYEIVYALDHLVTEEEISKILLQDHWTIKECQFNGSTEVCQCVVCDISDMDDKSPSTPRDYRHTALSAVPSVDDQESDWDSDYQAVASQDEAKKEAAAEESPVEPSEQLFDSGYQKSISNAEWSPQSPLDGTFEEHFSSCLKLDVNDIKETMKVDHNFKFTNNKVYTERKNKAGSSKKSPQKEKDSQPSTSQIRKKRKGRKSESDDDGIDVLNDDLKDIANCIVYNSLNRVHVDEEVLPIEEVALVAAAVAPEPERPYVVENGDLANNNRDNEGNNYPDEVPDVAFGGEDDANNANENLDVIQNNLEIVPLLPPRINQDHENRNDLLQQPLDIVEPVVNLNIPIVVEYDDDESEGAGPKSDIVEADESMLNHVSQEALFDPDSQLDLLEEFAIPDTHSDEQQPQQLALVAVANDVVIPEPNPFPHWLLHILAQQADEEANTDEPDFYCQGDGLVFPGVHPSIVEVDVDDTTSDSSTNDEAQAERTVSEDDVGSLPADNSSHTGALQVIGRSIPVRPSPSAVSNASTDEYYDTVEESGGAGGGNGSRSDLSEK